jgi:endonuclease YncB( thermonuclease family)
MQRLFFVGMILLGLFTSPAGASIVQEGKATVVSGDELRLNGIRFSLRAIDAFELGQQCWGPTTKIDCGLEAKRALEELVAGETVVCVRRGHRAREGATCVTHRWGLLNHEMLRRGWALARPDLAIDTTEGRALCELEAQAKRLRRGAWRYGKFGLPYHHRGEKEKRREEVSCGNTPIFRP